MRRRGSDLRHPFALALVAGAVLPMAGCAGPTVCTASADPLFKSAGHGCLRFGISTPGGPSAEGEFRRVTAIVGQAPSLVLSYADFAAAPPIDGLKAVARLGAEPMVTWEPRRWLGGDQYDASTFTLQSIADGTHDDYIYWWAESFAGFGQTVYLRFAHEPNGTGYPWTATQGTAPAVYVAAWRHVHRIFDEKHATNVKWVWAPNVSFPGSTSIVDTYPGPDFVDVVGVDGYNWGTASPTGHWISPKDLFGPTIEELRAIAPGKPLLVTEVGCSDEGGDKAHWVGELIDYLEQDGHIAGFIWFDHDKEADWRLASTPESAAAFAEKLGSR